MIKENTECSAIIRRRERAGGSIFCAAADAAAVRRGAFHIYTLTDLRIPQLTYLSIHSNLE